MGISKKNLVKISCLLVFLLVPGVVFSQTSDTGGEPKLGSIFYFPKAGSGDVNLLLNYTTTNSKSTGTVNSETATNTAGITFDTSHSFTDFFAITAILPVGFYSSVASDSKTTTENSVEMGSPSFGFNWRILNGANNGLYLDLVFNYTLGYSKDNGFTGADLIGASILIGKESKNFAYGLEFGGIYFLETEKQLGTIAYIQESIIGYAIEPSVQWFLNESLDLKVGAIIAIVNPIEGSGTTSGAKFTVASDTVVSTGLAAELGFQVVPNRTRINIGLLYGLPYDSQLVLTYSGTPYTTDTTSSLLFARVSANFTY